jgi:hypothetical protein
MAKLSISHVFGRAGEVYPALIDSMLTEALGTPYVFTSTEEFRNLPPDAMSKAYWEEMLCRVHWAATSNLARHKRWFEAAYDLSLGRSNYPGFCAALRGLVEAAADASHSLGAVPETLASHSSLIIESLSGHATFSAVSEDLESMLIHFQFARRLRAGEDAPATHRAKRAADYIAAIQTELEPVQPLYAELCEVVHPAAQSLNWLTRTEGRQWSVSAGNDSESIRDLCRRHMPSIEWVQQQSVNVSIFMLQVLEAFPLYQLQTRAASGINMQSVALWHKIKSAFAQNGVQWSS